LQTFADNKERRNRQDLIGIYKIYKGFIKLDTGELFVEDLNGDNEISERTNRPIFIRIYEDGDEKKVLLLTQMVRRSNAL